MNPSRIDVKVHFDDLPLPATGALIEILHRWVDERKLDEVMVDVADYSHVGAGPGVMLICHQANYSFDTTDGRWGLLYSRKREDSLDFVDRLDHSFEQVARAANLVATELGIDFELTESMGTIQIRDRMAAIASSEQQRELERQIEAALDRRLHSTRFQLRSLDSGSGFLRWGLVEVSSRACRRLS